MSAVPHHLWDTPSDDLAVDASSQWTAGVVFETFGEKLGIRTNEPGILDRILEALPPVREMCDDHLVENLYSLQVAPRHGRGGKHTLYRNAARLYRSKNLEFVLGLLEDEIRQEVAYWADDDYIFVHAGVVAINDKAIVLPGNSGAGKSTLVAALIDAGAEYYSDDMAVFDPSGRVIAYPTPLSIRRNRAVKKDIVPVSPAQIGRQPRAVGLVLETRYDAAVKRWQPRALSRARTIMSLFNHTLAARRLPKQAIRRFSTAVDGARAYRGRRREAADIMDWIKRQVS
ncbi:MAG: hypothetical protein ABFS02_12495 [Pseudomonadota bacterium]